MKKLINCLRKYACNKVKFDLTSADIIMQQSSTRPYLIPALDTVKRSNQCNMFNSVCVIQVMHDLGYTEQADWLGVNLDMYLDILIEEYYQWMQQNEPESLVQQVARETGLEIIEE